MGRGNCCVSGPYEGLFYIDSEDYHIYRRNDDYEVTSLLEDVPNGQLDKEWLFDDIGTSEEQEDIEESFIEDFTEMFPSFKRCCENDWRRNGSYGDYSRRAILENELFYVAIEDNEWSVAVELIQKEDPYGDRLLGLQAWLHIRFLDGMKKCLLNRLPSIGTYSGAWTSGKLTKEEFEKEVAKK